MNVPSSQFDYRRRNSRPVSRRNGNRAQVGLQRPDMFTRFPAGVRFTDFNSVFPAAINTAATFDKDLMFKRAQALAREFKGKGVNVVLGKGMFF